MASGIDVSQLGTFNPIELDDIKKVVAERFFTAPEFEKVFTIFDGYDKKTQLVLADELGLSGILDSSNVRPQSGGMGITLADKFVETVLVGDTKLHTQASFDKDFKMVVRKSAKDYNELSETDAIAIYITEKMITYMQEARWRLAMLGDTAADINTNGGNLVNTYTIGGVTYTNTKLLWNLLDGVWKQLKTAVGTSLTPRTTIAENYAFTKATQLAITDAHAFDAIKGAYDKAPNDLKNAPNAQFLVTSGIYNGYKNYLMSGALSGGGITQMLVDGIPQPAYNGIPILLDDKTTNTILKYTNVAPSNTLNGATLAQNYTELTLTSTAGFPESGKAKLTATGDVFVYTSKTATKLIGASQALQINANGAAITLFESLYDMPHRVLLHTPTNFGFYTLNNEDITSLESFYDKITRTNYMGYGFTMDVVIGREELCSVAY